MGNFKNKVTIIKGNSVGIWNDLYIYPSKEFKHNNA